MSVSFEISKMFVDTNNWTLTNPKRINDKKESFFSSFYVFTFEPNHQLLLATAYNRWESSEIAHEFFISYQCETWCSLSMEKIEYAEINYAKCIKNAFFPSTLTKKKEKSHRFSICCSVSFARIAITAFVYVIE